MKRFANDLVRDVGSVIVAGVDVVDSETNCLPNNGEGGFAIAWRPPDHLTGKLHRTVSNSVERERGAGWREDSSRVD
jgi:hypothetical protein